MQDWQRQGQHDGPVNKIGNKLYAKYAYSKIQSQMMKELYTMTVEPDEVIPSNKNAVMQEETIVPGKVTTNAYSGIRYFPFRNDFS